jgi:hypothetical protein
MFGIRILMFPSIKQIVIRNSLKSLLFLNRQKTLEISGLFDVYSDTIAKSIDLFSIFAFMILTFSFDPKENIFFFFLPINL